MWYCITLEWFCFFSASKKSQISCVLTFNRLQMSQTFFWLCFQLAKKVVSDSPGLVDFAIRLVNSVFNLPDGQVMFYEEFEWQKNKKFLGLVEMTSRLVNASFSLPEWQAVKMIFFWFLKLVCSIPSVIILMIEQIVPKGVGWRACLEVTNPLCRSRGVLDKNLWDVLNSSHHMKTIFNKLFDY